MHREFSMFSKPLAFALLAVGCLTAAAGGASVATRHNTADLAAVPPAAATQATPAATPAENAAQPVAETEAPVSPVTPAPAASVNVEKEEAPAPVTPRRPARAAQPPPLSGSRSARTSAPTAVSQHESASAPQSTATQTVPPPPVVAPPAPAATTVADAKPDPPKPFESQPEPPRTPQFEELVLPASSVIGLQVETALSSERAQLEDRVDARVTRDVLVNGRVAIPAGSRVFGSVTLVDRGGKVKGAARLGIRFHTLVLADGSEVALNTEPFYRDGESPAGDSAKKIGGATAVGAILGGILGGGKGAVIGGATGAAGGTAAAMAGDRNAAVVAAGSIVTVHLSAPATIQVEKRES
jgi:type IV secretory pathway VirB10-like protein